LLGDTLRPLRGVPTKFRLTLHLNLRLSLRRAPWRLKLSHRKGRPPKLRSRYVVLDREGIAFFKLQVKDMLPGAPLFTEDGQKAWRRDMWAEAVRKAVAVHNKTARGAARVPSGASAYSFRHARISELLQVYGVDPLTVGAQTGTSLRMIERAYYKLIPSVMREKLAAVEPTLPVD